MRRLLLPGLCFFFLIGNAQFTVNIDLDAGPTAIQRDSVFVAGSFNGWNPDQEKSRMVVQQNGRYLLRLTGVQAGSMEFKFTRGSWNRVETNENGGDIPNRVHTITSDTTIFCRIAAWKDNFKRTPTVNTTASAQVKIIDTAFTIPQLNRTRRIWIYFPKDYRLSEKNYPVLYMHDGQNLFDAATSFAGEWGVDEILDSMNAACIVIGIDNGGVKRMNEYNPNTTERFGTGEGKEYLDFIVKKLKPYIDTRYRTLKDRANTYMAGSSMGGLISFYAGVYHPGVFGSLGVFSPSFMLVPELEQQINDLPAKQVFKRQRYYFYAGAKEGTELIAHTQRIQKKMEDHLRTETAIRINEEGRHQESWWRKELPAFIEWMMAK